MLDENSLHDYQLTCVNHILRNPFCGVFLDMGLGKTITTLTAIVRLYFLLDIHKVLIIAPKRVVESVWQEEAANWQHTKWLKFSKIIGTEKQRIEALKEEANIYLISRDNIVWLCEYYNYKLPYDMIVVDELSSFKSYKSKRFKALRKVRPTIKRFVGLTGTPAPNGLIDIWPQIYLMDMGIRLFKTISTYRLKYFKPDKVNGYVVYKYKLLPGADTEIYNKIGDICISMKATDYLKMPDIQFNFIRLTMPDSLKAKYKAFEREKIYELSNTQEISVLNAATLSNKLLQFANGAIYDEDKNVHEIHELKLEALREIIEDANGKSVLVAWSYQFDRDRIMNYLKDYKPRELKTADDIKEWNSGNVQVMLAHPASAGHGLNLQAGGNIIVWYGLTWSLELYQQFNARLYRQGQKKGIIVHHLITQGTHDEDVIKAIKSKDRQQESLMASIKARINKYLQK